MIGRNVDLRQRLEYTLRGGLIVILSGQRAPRRLLGVCNRCSNASLLGDARFALRDQTSASTVDNGAEQIIAEEMN